MKTTSNHSRDQVIFISNGRQSVEIWDLASSPHNGMNRGSLSRCGWVMALLMLRHCNLCLK